jgi:hypothetical protein
MTAMAKRVSQKQTIVVAPSKFVVTKTIFW